MVTIYGLNLWSQPTVTTYGHNLRSWYGYDPWLKYSGQSLITVSGQCCSSQAVVTTSGHNLWSQPLVTACGHNCCSNSFVARAVGPPGGAPSVSQAAVFWTDAASVEARGVPGGWGRGRPRDPTAQPCIPRVLNAYLTSPFSSAHRLCLSRRLPGVLTTTQPPPLLAVPSHPVAPNTAQRGACLLRLIPGRTWRNSKGGSLVLYV